MPNDSILIVGAGPAGLVMANSLSMHGVDYTIIDVNGDISPHSKALSLNSASLKLFHGLNVVEDILNNAKPMQKVYLYQKNQRSFLLNMKYLDSPYNYFATIPQPSTERILENALKKKGKYVSRNICFVDCQKSKSGMYNVRLRDELTGQLFEESYSIVVGCDGANSTVRNFGKFSEYSYDYHADFIVADIELEHPFDHNALHYFIHEQALLIILPMQGKFTRVVIKGEFDDKNSLKNINKIEQCIRHYTNQECNVKQMIWYSATSFFSRFLSGNMDGRLFLVGDAFHMFSPIGGMGMNTGVQDAMNLACKLIDFVKHKANVSLLKLYQVERMKKVKEIHYLTDIHTKLILGRIKNHPVRSKFQTSFNNRSIMRYILPGIFSGMLTRYPEKNQCLQFDSFLAVNEHTPYIKLQSNDYGINNTYEIFSSGRHCLIATRTQICESLIVWLQKNEKLFAWLIPTTEMSEKFHYPYIVRPDGMVGWVGLSLKTVALAELKAYVNMIIGKVGEKECLLH